LNKYRLLTDKEAAAPCWRQHCWLFWY